MSYHIIKHGLASRMAVLAIGLLAIGMAAAEIPSELQEQLEEIRSSTLVAPSCSSAEQLIARAVLQSALTQHYNRMTFTPMLSSQWFQSYFEMLDPAKELFRQNDLDDFESFSDQLYNPNTRALQLNFATEVYQRLMERLRENLLFCAQELYREHDFSVAETLPIRRRSEDLHFPASEAEQHDLWRRNMKNLLLVNRLVEEELAKIPAEPDGESKPASRRKDFRERTLRSMISVFKLRCELTSIDILEFYLNAYLALFDPHTNYLAPETKEDFDISMRLSLQGIGATLRWVDGYTTIASLVPGGPAARDGRLKPGDQIIAVGQTEQEEPLDVVGMKLARVVQYIRGPKGSEVFLTVIPEGSNDTVVYRLVRDQIVLKDSEAQSFIHRLKVPGREQPARVLQLYLPSFYSDFGARDHGEKNYKSTTGDLRRLLNEALEKGPLDGVVLDLRGNGGGALDEAVALCGLFQANFPVVQVRDQQGGVNILRPSRKTPLYNGPMMVMVDRNSASASEIVAACLQDTGRALIVGDHSTHGKGTVQSLNDLAMLPMLLRSRNLLGDQQPGSLKLTMAKFYRINGGSTQERGVEPDIVFPSFLEYMDTSEKTLPHCLPWDEIKPANYTRMTRLDPIRPLLKRFAEQYMAKNAAFAEFAKEVAAYRELREQKELPLEIEARRKFREREQHAVRMIRRFRPKRTGEEESEEPEALQDDEEKLLKRQRLPEEDVALEATLAIMTQLIHLQE